MEAVEVWGEAHRSVAGGVSSVAGIGKKTTAVAIATRDVVEADQEVEDHHVMDGRNFARNVHEARTMKDRAVMSPSQDLWFYPPNPSRFTKMSRYMTKTNSEMMNTRPTP